MKLRGLLFAALCGLVAGCGEVRPGSVPSGGACLKTSDCLAPFVCGDGVCQAASTLCSPGRTRCNGRVLETCSETGTRWEEIETCELGCLSSATPACRAPECEPQARRCQDGFVQQCRNDGSGWSTLHGCPTECVESEGEAECTSPVCVPFETRCAEGASLETCNARGTAWVQTACPTLGPAMTCFNGRCEPRACEPGVQRCRGQVAEACNEAGTGYSAREVCEDGCALDDEGEATCVETICAPLQTRCLDESTLETCDVLGREWVPATCTFPSGEGVCIAGACVPKLCEPAQTERCEGTTRQVCNELGTAFEAIESCGFSCLQSDDGTFCGEPACASGEQRCVGGHTLEECAPDRVAFTFGRHCATGCVADEESDPPSAQCAPNVCEPLTRACRSEEGASFIEICRADGTAWERLEDCPAECEDARCVVPDELCTPGETRCAGVEVEVCVATEEGGTEWRFEERCLGHCQSGACSPAGSCAVDGFEVTALADDEPLPCDGVSTFLLHTTPVRGASGALVPDGTMVTFAHDGGDSLLTSADADPSRPGLQRPTAGGVAVVALRAPQSCDGARTVTVSASLGGRCTGTGTLVLDTPEPSEPPKKVVYLAEDFSTTRHLDAEHTTALLDRTAGTATAEAAFVGGDGRDGVLEVDDGTTMDLVASGHARFWEATAFGELEASVEAHIPNLSPGDHVLVIELWGPSQDTLGNYELKTVAGVEAGRILFREPVRTPFNPAGGRVVVQRIPQFRSVTVPASSTLTATAPTQSGGRMTGGTGVLAFRVSDHLRLDGKLSVNGRGWAAGTSHTGAWSTTPQLNRLLPGTANAAGNAGIVVVHARRVTFGTAAGALVQADGSGSGYGGTIWFAGGEITMGTAHTRLFARGGARDGRIRLDVARLNEGAASGDWQPAAPVAHLGPTSAVFQSTPVYDEADPSLEVRRVELLGVVEGPWVVAPDGLSQRAPGLQVEVSADGGATYGRLHEGEATFAPDATPASGKRVLWRSDFSSWTDEPLRLRGAALRVELQ